jgi:DNA-binding transcriptional regulator YdaS (Cro superfamily)
MDDSMDKLARDPIGRAALDEAIARSGGLVRLASAVGVSYQLMQGWRAENRKYATPAEYALAVESASGVSRHRLRPDVFGPPPVGETATESAAGAGR